MRKYADKYFLTDPWKIIEEGFNPDYSRVAESVFSLGNEYMGLRGYFDEGYSGESLQGSYLNGVYESRAVPNPSHYLGMVHETDFMLNTVDWVYTRINCNAQTLDLAKVNFSKFSRVLDMRVAVLTRRFVWHVDAATDASLCFERVLSMDSPLYGGARFTAECLKGRAEFQIKAGLDFSREHTSMNQNLWNCSGAKSGETLCEILGETQSSKQKLFAVCSFNGIGQGEPVPGEKLAALEFKWTLEAGESRSLTRIAGLVREKTGEDFAEKCVKVRKEAAAFDYDVLKAQSAVWWQKQWELSDIKIEGDKENQQGIRFCVFQMNQTLHTAENSAVVGAKGLTGEAYNGNTFWDTEVYCLPFYLFNNPAAAQNILKFRYDTLAEAKKRAAELDLAGAFYPVATIGGRECCDLWQHSNLQMHPSTSVMYGIWLYVRLTGDKRFLFDMGVEILVEICRMLATRGSWAPDGSYGYYGVMGLDEFHMMVNNNCYTNFMARKSFDYTIEALGEMRSKEPKSYEKLAGKLGLNESELGDWRKKSAAMNDCYDENALLFEQHDGYFNLPHTDLASVPPEEFPLYSHWSYDRIYRSDMIKQPDVLMFLLLYASEFTGAQIAANYDYYEPRCIHESSLSPSVHSILAAQIGRQKAAYDLFAFATRLDLDNYNRNTHEGLHTTSIAGAWMNIVFGFGGLRCDRELLSLSPSIPAEWKSYRFKLLCAGCVVEVGVTPEEVVLGCDGECKLTLYGETVSLNKDGYRTELRIQK